MVAGEPVEATRAIQAGYVTRDRTLLIASTHRVFTVDEKMSMGDGRVDEARMQEIARRFSRRAHLADIAAAASAAKAPPCRSFRREIVKSNIPVAGRDTP